jgi:hypothetical protein
MRLHKKLPFAGIVDLRPYDQAIAENVDWLAIKPVWVPFNQLYLTQKKLTVLGLFGVESYSTDPHIRVVEWTTNLYVEDGHHRLIERAIQRGQTSQSLVLCRVFNFADAL